jgi:hypothetical protein
MPDTKKNLALTLHELLMLRRAAFKFRESPIATKDEQVTMYGIIVEMAKPMQEFQDEEETSHGEHDERLNESH